MPQPRQITLHRYNTSSNNTGTVNLDPYTYNDRYP